MPRKFEQVIYKDLKNSSDFCEITRAQLKSLQGKIETEEDVFDYFCLLMNLGRGEDATVFFERHLNQGLLKSPSIWKPLFNYFNPKQRKTINLSNAINAEVTNNERERNNRKKTGLQRNKDSKELDIEAFLAENHSRSLKIQKFDEDSESERLKAISNVAANKKGSPVLDTTLLNLWFEKVIEYQDEKPQYTFDFILFFVMMNAYPEALSLLAKIPQSSLRDWLLIEIYLMNDDYVLALEISQKFLEDYSEDPEASFVSFYGQALALYGLGRISEAIEIIQAISNVRPHYRSSLTLLNSWRKEKVG